MKHIYILLLMLSCLSAKGQRDYHWVFGDSVGINFNTNPPSVDTNRIITAFEPSASISDPAGNLLFYVGSNELGSVNAGYWQYQVRGSNDSVLMGGDSLLGFNSATQGIVILPVPYDTSKYYIFHKHIDLYYSIVDMTLNNGLGAITTSNIFLEDSAHEKMHAVKAANGRDWWLLIGHGLIFNNISLSKFKIDSSGIHHNGYTSIASNLYAGFGQMIFSPQGDKIGYTGGGTDSKLFSFDRCTGNIFNETLLHSNVQNTVEYGCSFSPSGRYVYLSNYDSLWRFDTQSPNLAASQQTVFAFPFIGLNYIFGQHQLGPDGKIYVANPYASAHNIPVDSINTYLSVINDPDSTFFNFEPFSFSLYGRKCYLNLPNIPNYNLGALENVNCDSILAVHENKGNVFKIFPNPGNGKFNIELLQQVESITVDVYTLLGNNIYTKQLNSFNSVSLDLSEFPDGIYLIRLITENQVLGSRKLIISR